MNKNLFYSKGITVFLIAFVCCLLWGSAFPVIKIGYRLFEIPANDYSSQILFAGIRFFIAGILTIIFGSFISKRVLIFKKNNFSRIIILSLFQTILQYVFFYIGLANAAGTKSSVINSVSVFFSVIIACVIMKKERLTINKAMGCLIGFLGVIIVNFNGTNGNGFALLGEGLIIISALSYAISSVMIKEFSQYENPVALSGYQFAFGGMIMALIGILLGGKLITISIKGIIVLLYLGLLSAIAYTLWGILLKYNDVSRVTVFGFMTPICGCVLSVIMLKENLSTSMLNTVISLVLVSIGIIAVNKRIKE